MMRYSLPRHKLLLGSSSPRRAELLTEAGIDFERVSIDCDESDPKGNDSADWALDLCLRKSKAFNRTLAPGELLLTADTVVWHQGAHLAKPFDREDAIRMLDRLSGSIHKVSTACALRDTDRSIAFFETTEVEFRPLHRTLIEAYVDTYKPFDKAGAYGIQEWLGTVAIQRIRGCRSNVVGLPLPRLIDELEREFGLQFQSAT